MSLIKCPECSNEISSEAFSCPKCGYPIKKTPEPIYEKRGRHRDPYDFYFNCFGTFDGINSYWHRQILNAVIFLLSIFSFYIFGRVLRPTPESLFITMDPGLYDFLCTIFIILWIIYYMWSWLTLTKVWKIQRKEGYLR
ncbi:MAG: hypothetical protein A2252_09570 [Elusimicrobia bacterium RIFOXYA2_FULL_39_19]|nr:MAG: hypothetical protein A2252_09570 [Elusimicrobia bacterium RIFOXYA2_FULL_39_19]